MVPIIGPHVSLACPHWTIGIIHAKWSPVVVSFPFSSSAPKPTSAFRGASLDVRLDFIRYIRSLGYEHPLVFAKSCLSD